MSFVRAKKSLGQHFLKDQNIARKIVDSLQPNEVKTVLEIGPGMGVLTNYLMEKSELDLFLIEIDRESVEFLQLKYPQIGDHLLSLDFLKFDLANTFTQKVNIIGNFPYNISSQIFFKVLENKDLVPQVVGMIQKEVAERIANKPGSKVYGIMSVLLQAFYDIEYLFTVNEGVFDPPPKVKSAVIRLTRNNVMALGCNEKLFFSVVKTSFNQRRKTLNNSLKPLLGGNKIEHEIMTLRPERLSVEQFVMLTNLVEELGCI